MNANKVTLAEARNFMLKLFKSNVRKTEKHAPKTKKSIVQISDKFTEKEKAMFPDNNDKELKTLSWIYKSPLIIDMRQNADPTIRTAVLNMGARTIYLDMNKASEQDIKAILSDLMNYPYSFR